MTHPELLEAMARPGFYPHHPGRVEVVQTHISFIFIAGDLVYKVKKSVDFGFLDFTTLEKRQFYCREEVRLNRRLAPETYLGVTEVFENGEGQLSLEPGGRVVEYAVVMKRLPLEKMLKKLIAEDRVEPAVMDAVAARLALFHRQAETGGKIDEIGGVATIRRNHDENFEQTEKYIPDILSGKQYRFIRAYIDRFMMERSTLLEQRVRGHRIRDCHGDLHLEHICLADNGIIIFDCIEFNERFRYEDVAAEVAFLAMDLDFNGHPDFGDIFVRSYIRHAGDPDVGILLNFYKCYYAYVRAKVTSFRSEDPAIDPGERRSAAGTAARYFDLACRYAAHLEKTTLILMAGLMGTGKSVLAGTIAPLLGAEMIRTDVLRKQMLNVRPADRHHEPFGEGIYSEAMTEKTYVRAHELAGEKLERGQSIIIDASYRKRAERLKAKQLALEAGADFFIIECICPEDIIRKRLEARLSNRGEASDGRWELFREQKGCFEPLVELSDREYCVIDTSETQDEAAWKALCHVRFGWDEQ